MRKPSLSPTKITTYLTCRVKYYWAYQTPYGRYLKRGNAQLALGANLHRALQAFHEQGGAQALSPEQIAQTLEQLWSMQGFRSQEESEHHKQVGHALIQDYYQRQVEQPSEAVPLFTEKMLRRDMGEFVLIGRIDRVDEHPDGTLEIIDYKSGRSTVSEEQVREDLALHCYALLIQEQYPDRPLRLSIDALRAGVKATVPVSWEHLQEFRELLVEIGHRILRDTFEVLEPELIPHCARCEFLPLCQRHFGLRVDGYNIGDE
ncbi:MAG: PD-(D/E)XK nuclease family protein [Fimbriimonadales bacterium]